MLVLMGEARIGDKTGKEIGKKLDSDRKPVEKDPN